MRYKKNNRGSYILTAKDGSEFTVTKKEYDEITKLTKRANQRRVDVAHRYYDGLEDSNAMVGIEYDTYMDLLESKGFITEKYTSSLKQFSSKKDVKNLIKELKEVTKRGYGANRLDDVRYKMIERINEQFGAEGEALKNRIESMDKADLLSVYLIADEDIIAEIFGSDVPADTSGFIDKTNTYIDKLLAGSKNKKRTKEESKKGFKNYKARQKTKKEKRAKKDSIKAGILK